MRVGGDGGIRVDVGSLDLGVQMFMSYDGGATPASLDTLQADMGNSWTSSEFGLLGSMDKIGMTACSMIWGRPSHHSVVWFWYGTHGNRHVPLGQWI